ncbi:MAG TPA: IMP dehydrogenase [Nanoarchaeota archaeon]|nr:IMP dehydrogenase [Candidatus Woesearchaeota archaeon]HIH15471.1 IMP dehydrogenase [Nanoarchaeota archaeon]HIH59274.1 IMP dehydrogenase [Nanoarchaeota archaeon]HII13931.1 IMP dehydrogenase [Nanoarchaeota archaeon]HIJ04689.1 IMP dehydrogenase [Nanoarchaeota archaeon]
MEIRTGLTYNDVLLIPKKTPLSSRSETELKTIFTRNISLNVPLVSSNMASVTEHKMAIAMARNGGLGVIHQFGTIEEQVEEVKKVKKSTSYIIEHPLTVQEHITLAQAIDTMKNEGVTSLLVLRGDELVGIFTFRDYLFEKDMNKRISEVMTTKERLVTAAYGISLEEAKEILHKHRIEKLPLMQHERLLGLITTKDIMKIETWPQANRDSKGRLRVGAAVGVKDTLQRAEALIAAGVDVLILDIAHAHSDFVIERLKELKMHFSHIDVMVGNIATADAARDLIEAGADGLKVGIGPSPVCTTRIISGSGVPQLTAVMDVYSVAKLYGVPVCADGGMKYPGDVPKALGAGATSVYSGSFFSGTDESPGMIIMKDGKRYKRYMGSASYDSNHERKESQDGKKVKEKLDVFVEGVAALVDYKGPVEEVIKGILKGVQSGFSYCGARTIQEMHEKAEFIQITTSAWEESLSHGMKLSD